MSLVLNLVCPPTILRLECWPRAENNKMWGGGADKEVVSTLGPSRTPGYLTLPKSALTEHIFSEDTGFYTQGGKHEQLAVCVHGP